MPINYGTNDVTTSGISTATSDIFTRGINITNQTASTITSFDINKNLTSLSTATYPSLTELSYVKGATSSIQTQLNSKQNTLTNPVTGTGIANHIPYWNSASGLLADSGQLYWDSTNNRLGIGITSPQDALHIVGSMQQSWVSSDIRLGTFYNNDWRMGINYGLANRTLNIFSTTNDTGGNIVFSTRVGSGVSATDYGTERMRINSSGNVGIGTSSPGATLDVRGSAVFNEDSGDHDFRVESDGASHMFFIDAGLNRIGINTASPGATLDVRGPVILNEDGGDFDFRVEGDTDANLLFVDAGADRIGIGTSSPGAKLHVVGSGIFASGIAVTGLVTATSGNFTSSLQLNNSGVALYDTSVFDLGTISGTNSINCGQDRQIQTITLNGTATTFTKGTGWPTTNTVARETTLNIYASGNTSITWTIVSDWYRQPDSPLPSGRHIVLLRSIGSGIIQGHYIGNKTN